MALDLISSPGTDRLFTGQYVAIFPSKQETEEMKTNIKMEL